jgi:eukaryotic-like serine/threonine-protein kinase
MALSAGMRLGPYEVVAPIGAGGMGEVYQAKDTRLDRTVAIKVLPAHLSADADRRARFEREAKTIAGLSHPHICTLHDVGEHDGATFLVMEHLTGETLAERLSKGTLPVDQALKVATEIADALSAAHRQGIVHRDLKPGNVMLTKAGAKLLDFGLAKLKGHGERSAAAHLASAPTQSSPLTAEGQIVGTLHYMAPEQLQGKPADARTDLWAFGAILYEMLAGKRAFDGDNAASLIGAILEREPAAIVTFQPVTPPSVDRLVKRCLAKNPDDRWDSAHDLADELRWMRETSGVGATGAVIRSPRGRALKLAAAAIAFLALVGATACVTWFVIQRLGAAATQVSYLELNTSPAEGVASSYRGAERGAFNRPSRTALALTPDGRQLVFAGRQEVKVRLFVRDLGAWEVKPIAGTEGAEGPFLSHDGRWVAFWVEVDKPDRKWVLKKVPLDGSTPPAKIAEISGPAPYGGSWGDDDRIVFPDTENGGLQRVSSSGDTREVLTTPRPGEYSHRLPHVLPGSKAVLVTVVENPWDWESARVVAYEFKTRQWRPVVERAADARYLPTGHLIYFQRGQLVAKRFDLESLASAGNERVLIPDVMQATNGVNSMFDSGASQVAVSANGTLAYLSGGQYPDWNKQLVWVNRNGDVEELPVRQAPFYVPKLSPDDKKVAVQTLQSERNVWVYDTRLPDQLVRVVKPELEAVNPVWTREGDRLVFGGAPKGLHGLFWARPDGTEQAVRLYPSDTWVFPASWTKDGRLLFIRIHPNTLHDIWMLSRSGDKWKEEVLLNEKAEERDAQISPNGRWLAYSSNESGGARRIVCVRRFPELSDLRQVGEGHNVVWARDGTELFYVGLGKTRAAAFIAHAVAPDGTVSPNGRTLFNLKDLRLSAHIPVPGYDVSLDGRRFLFVRWADTPLPPPPSKINVVLNWFEELKAKVPVR